MLVAVSSASSPLPAADAEALVAEGVALRKDHKDLEALRLFRLAYEKSPSPRIRAQIGLAEQAVGKWVEAEADLSAALADVTDPWIEKNGVVLRAALVSIREHLGWLELTGPAGASVAVNGVLVGKLPLGQPVRVVAGTVALEVTAEGYAPQRLTIDVAPATTVKHALPALVARPVDKAPPVVVREPSTRVPLATVAFLSLGVAGIAVGAWYGVQTFRLRSDRDEHCVGGCDPYGLGLDRDARAAAWTSTIAFGVGVAALGVASFLLVRTPSVVVSARVAPQSFVVGGVF